MFLDEGHRAGADAWAWWGDEGPHRLPGDTGNFSQWWTERFAPIINAWSPGA